MVVRIIIFLVINFAALGIGGLFTGKGVPSEWYQNLNQAPWTPPGWVFGTAWTLIMVCFAVYMAWAWDAIENKRLLLGLFAFQWVLNVGWNPVFFHFHNVQLGLFVISALTLLVGFFFIYFWSDLKAKSVLVLPYLIWLCIATSLNGYILMKN